MDLVQAIMREREERFAAEDKEAGGGKNAKQTPTPNVRARRRRNLATWTDTAKFMKILIADRLLVFTISLRTSIFYGIQFLT